MKHTSSVGKSNKAVLVLLILGLSAIAFPLYLTIYFVYCVLYANEYYAVFRIPC